MKTCDIKPAFEKDNIAIAFAVDSNYLPYLKYAIKSIAANLKRGNLDIIILHGGALNTRWLCDYFKDAKNLSIRFIDVGEIAETELKPYFTPKQYLTIAATYRLLLPELLTSYDKILWLDIDTAVTGDLSELFEIDLGDNWLGAVGDVAIFNSPPTVETLGERYTSMSLAWAEKYNFKPWYGYFNSGVLLMNLEALRKANERKRLVEIATDPISPMMDQGGLNIVCRGHVKYLDDKWNFQVYQNCKREMKDTRVIHYIRDLKPWHTPNLDFAEYWWKNVDDEPRILTCNLVKNFEKRLEKIRGELQEEQALYREIKHSFSYKLGRALTKPFRIFSKKKKK